MSAIDSTAEEIGMELEPVTTPPTTLFRTDDPVEVIVRATQVANALKGVITEKRLYKRIGDRDHVLVEAWTTLASMLGVSPLIAWTKRLEPTTRYDVEVKHYSGPKGQRVVARSEHYTVDGYDWEARAEVRTLDGRLIGAAEALCSRKESTWAKRDDYALKSMAQTRAVSRALRGPLGFVVTLAGYSATAAEEMPPEERAGVTEEAPPDETLPEHATGSEAQRLDLENRTLLEKLVGTYGLIPAKAEALFDGHRTLDEKRALKVKLESTMATRAAK